MSTTTPAVDRVLDRLRARGEVKARGKGWQCCCPTHDDKTPSLDIDVGGDGRVLLCCRSRACPAAAIAHALGLTLRDLFKAEVPDGLPFEQKILRTYDYRDEHGTVLFQAVRLWAPPPRNKDFRQRRPDGAGGWVWKLDDVRRVPYRLPELLAAPPLETVFVLEGEKDVDRAAGLGLVATTNPMGAGKWRDEFARFLKDRPVVVVPDNDDVGRAHARDIERSLAGVTASVRVVDLPGLPEKGDLSDWFDAGGSVERLLELVRGAGASDRASAPNPAATPSAPRPTPKLRTLPEYVPFPAGVLPSQLQHLILAGTEAIGCDPTFIALPALSALSAAIGATRRVQIKSGRCGWQEPPFVSTAVVAPSGTKKTPPYKLAAEDPAEDINDRLDREHRDALRAFEEAEEERKARPKGERGSRGSLPVGRRFSFSDITLECLLGKLSENPRGLLIHRDELDGWIKSFTRYASRGSSDLPSWLSLFNAATVNNSRKTGDRKDVRVRGVGVAVTGTIQPAVLREAMRPEFMAAGLFARLAIAMPPPVPRVWSDAELPDSVAAEYSQLIEDLFRLDFVGANEYGRRVPVIVSLSDAAKRRFIGFYNRNGEAIGLAEGNESAARSKMEGYAARFALIFHCCRTTLGGEIGETDMLDGIRLAEWFINESLRIYQVFAGPPDEGDTRDLSEKVRAFAERHGGRVTARDLHKSNRSRWPTAELAELALDSLVSAGEGQWEEPKGPGRPTRFFTPQPRPVNTETALDGSGVNADAA